MKSDYVCVECGQEFEELGNGKCYACGGDVIPIDAVGQKQEEPEEYPEDVMEEEEKVIDESLPS